jgi:DNA polymerase
VEVFMSEPSRPPFEEIARQTRQRLEALRAAGVEWLPKTVSPLEPPAAPSGAAAAIPAAQSLLFGQDPAPPAAGASPEQRRHELTVLAERVSDCVRCAHLAATRTRTVFGVGPLDPELCLVGEAPGYNEDKEGEPFVGEAGQLLNRILAACGLKREEVYVCNIIKCRPPGNRTPTAEEADHCREYLEKQLELVRPRFLCALGGTAATHLLGTKLSLGKLRGRFHDYKGIPVLCTYHPAFLLPHRSPEKKKDVWEDMKKLLARMGRPVP